MLLAVSGANSTLAEDDVKEDKPSKPSAVPTLQRVVSETVEKARQRADKSDKPAAPNSEPTAAPARPKSKKPAIGPQFIRLNLLDDSIISGELTIEKLTVDTDFGQLVVPISRIRSIKPGLDSYPQLAQELDNLIEELGSDEFRKREAAHKALVAKGPKMREQILLRADRADQNAERRQHIEKIKEELEKLSEEANSFAEPTQEQVIAADTIETDKFTIVGTISPDVFTINNKYGELTIKLADIRSGTRATEETSVVRRTVSVSGTHLAQHSFKNSGIRISAGDRIRIQADGQLVMSPWGSNRVSTPDGSTNYGQYSSDIPGGALVAKIGDSKEVFKVGSEYETVAKRSGILQFAVGMQAQYAQQGYAFPGQYNVKVKVETGGEEE